VKAFDFEIASDEVRVFGDRFLRCKSADGGIRRLTGLGATLLEGPIRLPNGGRIAFIQGPDDTRLELIERRIAGGSDGCGC